MEISSSIDRTELAKRSEPGRRPVIFVLLAARVVDPQSVGFYFVVLRWITLVNIVLILFNIRFTTYRVFVDSR